MNLQRVLIEYKRRKPYVIIKYRLQTFKIIHWLSHTDDQRTFDVVRSRRTPFHLHAYCIKNIIFVHTSTTHSENSIYRIYVLNIF